MKEITLADLAQKLGGSLDGDPEIIVSGVAPLDAAEPDQVSFLANPKYAPLLETTSAGAVIVSGESGAAGLNLIRVKDPYIGFAKAMELFYSKPYDAAGISDQAFIHKEAHIGDDPSIHPFAVICRGARIGSRVTVMSGAYVGPGVKIGDEAIIHPNVVLEENVQVGKNVIIHSGTVVGSDGFGFAKEGDRYIKIVQAGIVRIEDDVEIGACCAIDRAAMGETVIGRASKLDNLVQIGHNVKIGPNCIIVGQAGIAGSAELEANVIMAGQSGVAGHLKIGSGAVIMGKASALKDVPPGAHVAGTPAISAGEWRKAAIIFGRLDDLRKKISRLEKEFAKMKDDN